MPDDMTLLLRDLMVLARSKYGPSDGLLAAIFVADALKAGGVAKALLRLGKVELVIPKERAAERCLKRWSFLFGDKTEGSLTHHVLLFGERIVDPVLPDLVAGADGLDLHPAELYGAIEEHPIYRDKS